MYHFAVLLNLLIVMCVTVACLKKDKPRIYYTFAAVSVTYLLYILFDSSQSLSFRQDVLRLWAASFVISCSVASVILTKQRAVK